MELKLWRIPDGYKRQMCWWREEVSSEKDIQKVRVKNNRKTEIYITTCAGKNLVEGTKRTFKEVFFEQLFTEYDGLAVKPIKKLIEQLVDCDKEKYNIAVDKLYELKKYQSYNDMLRVHEELEGKDIVHIVFMSGRFFHLYPMNKGYIFKNQGDVISNYQNYLMNCVRSKYVVENRDSLFWAKTILNGEYNKELERAKKGDSPFIGIDTQTIGNIQQHGRLENTINTRSGLYCIPLTHEQIHSGYDNIIEIAKKPQYDGDFFIGKKILDLRGFDVKSDSGVKISNFKTTDKKFDFQRVSDEEFKQFIFAIFPRCLYAMFDSEPDYEVRWQACRLLYEYCYSPKEIIEICKQFNWMDFDIDKTTYQVSYICRTASADRSEVKSCLTMKELGLCVTGCKGFSDFGV